MNPPRPATLAAHGTFDRAQICADDCEACGPIRQRMSGYHRAALERARAASHEGKQAQGRMKHADWAAS